MRLLAGHRFLHLPWSVTAYLLVKILVCEFQDSLITTPFGVRSWGMAGGAAVVLTPVRKRALCLACSSPAKRGPASFLSRMLRDAQLLSIYIESFTSHEPPEVFSQKFFMKFFGHPTAKPTILMANTPQIVQLAHGKLSRQQLKCEVATTIKTVSKKTGRKQFQASKALKGTQPLDNYLASNMLKATLSKLYPETKGVPRQVCHQVPGAA